MAPSRHYAMAGLVVQLWRAHLSNLAARSPSGSSVGLNDFDTPCLETVRLTEADSASFTSQPAQRLHPRPRAIVTIESVKAYRSGWRSCRVRTLDLVMRIFRAAHQYSMGRSRRPGRRLETGQKSRPVRRSAPPRRQGRTRAGRGSRQERDRRSAGHPATAWARAHSPRSLTPAPASSATHRSSSRARPGGHYDMTPEQSRRLGGIISASTTTSATTAG